jgi:hypothetical protein
MKPLLRTNISGVSTLTIRMSAISKRNLPTPINHGGSSQTEPVPSFRLQGESPVADVIGYALRLRGGVNYHPVGGAVISTNSELEI